MCALVKFCNGPRSQTLVHVAVRKTGIVDRKLTPSRIPCHPQILFDEWMIAFYNVAFTFLPPLCIGVFDRQVRNDTLMRVPQLYRAGLEGSFVCRHLRAFPLSFE